jgi:hypothetical protein
VSSSRGKEEEGLRTAPAERNREGRVLEWGGRTGLEAEATVARLWQGRVGGDTRRSTGEEKERESEADQ